MDDKDLQSLIDRLESDKPTENTDSMRRYRLMRTLLEDVDRQCSAVRLKRRRRQNARILLSAALLCVGIAVGVVYRTPAGSRYDYSVGNPVAVSKSLDNLSRLFV